MELKGKKINFLGDSITAGFNYTGKWEGFVELIAGLTGAECRNYGECGTRIARQTGPTPFEACDRDFCLRAEQMEPEADVIAVFGGTNDYGHGNAPVGSPEDRTPWTFYGALNALYAGLKQRYPDALIFVMTPTHRCADEKPSEDQFKVLPGLPLKDYVEIIRSVAAQYELPVLDLFAEGVFDMPDNDEKSPYTLDGVHPAPEGHRLLADRVIRFLENL